MRFTSTGTEGIFSCAALSSLESIVVAPFLRLLGVEFRHRGLARKLDAAALVDIEALDLDDVADLADAFHRLEELVGELADVAESVHAGENFDERAEVLDARHLALVDLAGFGDRGNRADGALGRFHRLEARREDRDLAVVVDVDLGAGRLDDAADVRTAGTDERADLVDGNLHLFDPRRVLVEFGARSGDDRLHEVDDLDAGVMGGLDGAFDEIPRETAELEVDLEAGDALLRAADLEVHVAAVVFGAEDVGDENFLRLVGIGEKPDGNAGDRAFERNARVHERETAVADRGHRRRAVRAHDFRNDADRIRKIIRENLRDGALGERAVPDFAAAGRTEAADFAGAVGREVVVEHEALGGVSAGDGVEILSVLLGAERDRRERLGLAAREDGASVNAREHPHLSGQRTDLVLGSSVDAFAVDEHVVAHRLDFERVEEMHEADGVDLGPLLGNLPEEVFLDGGNLALTLELALDEERRGESFAAFGAHEVHLVLRLRDILDVLVGKAERAAHFDLEIDDLLHFLMGALQSGDEVLVGNLGGRAFHHEELAAETRVKEVDIALRLLLVRGVDDPLAVDAADAHAADRAHERDLGDVQRRRRGVDGEEVGLARAVALDERRVDLNVVVVSVGEERTDRAVAHARREDFLRRGTRFALEEAAGELARGIELLAVFALQREEIDSFARRVGVGDRREDGRVTVGNGDGSGCLLSQKPGLDHEVRPRDVDLELLCTLHCLFSLFFFLFVNRLAAETELLDELLVARFVLALEVVEKVAAVGDLAEEAVTAGVVLLVGLEVFGQRLDLAGENRDLHFAGSGIAVVTLEFILDGGLVEFHCFYVLSSLFCKPGSVHTLPKRHLVAYSLPAQTGTRGRDNLLRQSQDGAYFTKY